MKNAHLVTALVRVAPAKVAPVKVVAVEAHLV